MKVRHRDIDFNYIFAHFDQAKYEIPSYYDREVWTTGETYRIRIGHIYDPSKFWIILKERELDILQKFLLDFYTKNGDQYKMSVNTASKNIYCAVYAENAFYRGLIINIPQSTNVQKKAWVFLFDFGYIAAVHFDDLYYLHEKMYVVPQFAVRASLSHVQPYNKPNWDNSVVTRFSELVSGKLLLCVLECTDPSRKIVYINIGDVHEASSVMDIGYVLINEKLAKSITNNKCSPKVIPKNNSRYVPKTKYPYLFPSFEAIEKGMVPSCVYTSEILRQCIATDVLFKPYYAYKGIIEN